MSSGIGPLEGEDATRVEQLREWVVGHYGDPSAYRTLDGKLRLIQTILDKGWIEKEESWKLQALGIAFGDALVQAVPELFWVLVDDETGRDPALRWLQTSTLVFPMTAISKRVEDDITVDVRELFKGFQKAVRQASRRASTRSG